MHAGSHKSVLLKAEKSVGNKLNWDEQKQEVWTDVCKNFKAYKIGSKRLPNDSPFKLTFSSFFFNNLFAAVLGLLLP